jgi:tetratricopeptide (TPR) repeat protein
MCSYKNKEKVVIQTAHNEIGYFHIPLDKHGQKYLFFSKGETMIFRIIPVFILLLSIFTANADASGAQDSGEYTYSKAMLLKSEKKYSESISLLKSLTEDKDNLDRVYYQIASCYQLSNESEQAILFAKKSIETNPKYPDPYILIFDISLFYKNNDDAAEILSDLLDEMPELYQYHYTLGILYYQNIENFKLAANSFSKVIEISKNNPIPSFYKEQSQLILSEIFFAQKDYQKSIEALDEAVKVNIRNSTRYYRYASSLLNNGYYDSSRICMEKFITNLPTAQKNNKLVLQLYSYLGNIYYITSNQKALSFLKAGSGTEVIEEAIAKQLYNYETTGSAESIAYFEKMSSSSEYSSYVTPHIALAKENLIKKDNDKAFQYLMSTGSLLSKTDMIPSAAQYFLEAHKLKETEKEPVGYLAQLYEQMGNKRLAVLYFKKYLTFSKDPEVALHLAFLYDILDEKNKSDKLFDELIEENANNARIYFIKGLILSRHDKYSEAEQNFRKAIEIRSDDPVFYYYLATIQEKQNKKTDSEASLIKALEFDKQNASYKNFLGYMYADANIKLDEANKLIDEALKTEPFNGAYLDSLGWVYYRQGKNELALRKLKLAMRSLEANGESDPVVYDHLGDTFFNLGKKVKAVEFWNKSISLKKDPGVEKKIKSADAK